MIIHLVATNIFWINYFSPSKPVAVMSNAKGPGKLVLGNVVDYKICFRLHPGKYVQVHQEDEPLNTIDI